MTAEIAILNRVAVVLAADSAVTIGQGERASQEQESVGGPIDVAVISRHEGFVWVKRKHYFRADLNPRYFWRKYRSQPTQKTEENHDE